MSTELAMDIDAQEAALRTRYWDDGDIWEDVSWRRLGDMVLASPAWRWLRGARRIDLACAGEAYPHIGPACPAGVGSDPLSDPGRWWDDDQVAVPDMRTPSTIEAVKFLVAAAFARPVYRGLSVEGKSVVHEIRLADDGTVVARGAQREVAWAMALTVAPKLPEATEKQRAELQGAWLKLREALESEAKVLLSKKEGIETC